MNFAEIYQKIDEEVLLLQRYIDLGTWTKSKSEFFDSPHKGTLSTQKTTLKKICADLNQSASGIYLFVCNNNTTVNSVKDFNSGQHLSKMRMTDNNSAIINAGQVLYIGECDAFSSRISAHLSNSNATGTVGLHLYLSNRINIKPECFDLIIFPLKECFYPQNIDSEYKQSLREMIEIKLRAIYIPWVGK